MAHRILHGDCLEHLRAMAAEGAQVDSIVTDPPAGISFMGRAWDSNRGGRDAWIAWMGERAAAALEVVPPGAHALVWALPRTSHWTATAWEDAGWQVRDRVAHLFGTGFPKGKHALKPACEDWWLLRRPGKGALNIDGCRVGTGEDRTAGGPTGARVSAAEGYGGAWSDAQHGRPRPTGGRWPAHVTHDGSPEVLEAFAAFGERKSSCHVNPSITTAGHSVAMGYKPARAIPGVNVYSDAGTAARFFYSAKASKADRAGSTHPTCKNVSLLRWLARLITPPGGTICDPFAGSGSLGTAAEAEGFGTVLIESEAEYIADIRRRLSLPELAAAE
jgi:site-specific DNA-methyltransferase (adenine-specific)